MKFLSLVAFAGAVLGIQQKQTAGVEYLANNTLSSEYLADAFSAISLEHKKALTEEQTEASRMLKYYQGVANKTGQ